MPVLPLKLSDLLTSACPDQSCDLCVLLLEIELAVGSSILVPCLRDLSAGLFTVLVIFKIRNGRGKVQQNCSVGRNSHIYSCIFTYT